MKSKIYRALKWLLFIFVLSGAFVYFKSFSGFLFILASIIALPFLGLEKYFEKAFPIEGLREVVLVGVLVIAIFFAPELDFDKNEELPYTPTVSEQLVALHSAQDTVVDDTTAGTESEFESESAQTTFETESVAETDVLVTDHCIENAEITYVLNKNSKKFHEIDCSSVKTIKDKNREDFTGTRDEALSLGYEPCGRCKP